MSLEEKVLENNVSVDMNDSSVTYESLIPNEGLDRPDTSPMFADEVEERVWTKQNNLIGQKRYVPFLSQRPSCPSLFQRRELFVLFMGCFMMCLSLALIVTGVIRIHTCDQSPKIDSTDRRQTLSQIEQLVSINNYALEKPAYQSSMDSVGFADRVSSFAVDGDLQTCAHTDVEERPKWWVDLGNLRPISQVVVINRRDFPLQSIEIYIGTNITVDMGSLCYRQSDDPKDILSINCSDRNGRYITIAVNSSNEMRTHLVLCEVIVLER
ncbi:hypothetical protein ScPMuIL_006750 [Solemya velum]